MSNRRNYSISNQTTSISSHVDLLATEATQKQVLEAVKGINIDVGEIVVGDITVESSDTVTHTKLDITNTKLDTLNTTVVNKHLNTTDDSVTIGEVVAGVSIGINNFPSTQTVDGSVTVNTISGFATETTTLQTNVHLDNIESSLNDTNDTLANIFGKNLNSASDSVTAVVPKLNFATDSVNVVEEVKSVTYDLDILGEQMYADSINSATIDAYGREGWYWTNDATTGGSNCYWYSNSTVPQNDMSKAGIECVYVILALDRVQPDIVLPFVSFYSKPTGSGDIIPGFAHSSWTYTIPATHYLNAGEVVMLTIGDHTKVANIQPELRRIHLVLNGTNGQAGIAEIIAYITLNTDSGLKALNGIQYLLKNAGFYYDVTDKTTDYVFLNSIERKLRLNLSGKEQSGGLENIYVSINTTNGLNQISANNSNELKVEVTNFPTAFEVSNFPTSTEVSNFPATQTVDGSVSVSNFPTSTEVSNFPTSTEVSNFPATQTVDGSVSVSNFPTGFEVSNFPTSTQVSNFPATQTVDGSVSVSNFPTSTEVSNFPTSTEVSNFPATQTVDGSVSVSNFPTSTEVSNFPATVAVTGTFFQITQPVSGSVSVSNLPATQPVSGSVSVSNFPTSTQVSNFPATQAVSGSVSVSNLPATQPVSGSVSISNLPATQPVSGSVSVSNFPATQPISGSISNLFTLDTTTVSTNTKLDTIHSDLDGLTFDGSSNLNVNVVAGSISVSSVNIKDSAGNNLNSTSNALNTYLTNSSVDTHCYASSNGTTWHHLSSDSNGQLNVHSKTQDGAGTDITSTLNGAKQSLDVNVSNTVPVSGSVSVSNFPSSTNSHTQAYDPTGGGGYFDVTSTTISASISALDVAVKNTVPVSGAFFQTTQPVSVASSLNVNINDFAGNSLTSDTFTFNGNPKNGLDVAIINNSSNAVPVSGTFYPVTQQVSGSVSVSNFPATQPVSGTVSVSGTVPVSGTFYPSTQTVSGTVAITDSLGGNIIANSNSLQVQVTNVSIPVTGYVDAYLKDGVGNAINSTSSAINSFLTNTKTTNDYSATGLNVYQIYPKIKSLALTGLNNITTADTLMAGQNSNIGVNAYQWGKINANKSYWLYTPLNANVRTISYNYINSLGNEATGTATGIVNSYVPLQSNIVCLNNFTVSGGVSITSTDALYITLAGSGGTNLAVCSLVAVRYNMNNAIFTVPNNAIALITSIDALLGTSNEYYYMNVWDANGNRSVPNVTYNYSSNVNNYRASGGDYGCIGRILTAGETVAFSTGGTSATNKNIIANIKVIYL
jgi:hypothetical protein